MNSEIEPQDQPETSQSVRKAWVTPVVSESPVNEFTELTLAGTGADGGLYS